MRETTIPAELKKTYSLKDIQKWIDYGVRMKYVDVKNNKSLFKWISILKELSITIS